MEQTIISFILSVIDYCNYIGFDFSLYMIKLSKERIPTQVFLQHDIRNDSIKSWYFACKIFICLETLEHIEDDLKVIDLIPEGATIIFSVPTYNFKSHVRYFSDKESVIERYSPLIDIDDNDCNLISNKIWLCKGIRNGRQQ